MSNAQEQAELRKLHVLKAFKDLRSYVGWIAPNGEIHPTALWEHVHFFIEHTGYLPELSAFLEPYHRDQLEPQLEEHRESGRQWHEFYEVPMTVNGELEHAARQIAYLNGWGRIGCYLGDKVELECFEEHRRNLSKHVKEFAEMLDRTMTIQVVEATSSENQPPI